MALGSYLQKSEWYGRENELVNLFAHSFLAAFIQVTQIGIEVAVKQLPRADSKVLVRKDLVVWNKPNDTVWIGGVPLNDPAVIVEFKVNDSKKCRVNLDWLSSYTELYPHVVGFSVCGYLKQNRRVTFARVERGKIAAEKVAPTDAVLRIV